MRNLQTTYSRNNNKMPESSLHLKLMQPQVHNTNVCHLVARIGSRCRCTCRETVILKIILGTKHFGSV